MLGAAEAAGAAAPLLGAAAAASGGVHLDGAAAGDVLDAGAGAGVGGGAAARHRARMLALEAQLQVSMDCEDRRVKELTEGVLYDFLPAALTVCLPASGGGDAAAQLDPEACRVSSLASGFTVTGTHRELLKWVCGDALWCQGQGSSRSGVLCVFDTASHCSGCCERSGACLEGHYSHVTDEQQGINCAN